MNGILYGCSQACCINTHLIGTSIETVWCNQCIGKHIISIFRNVNFVLAFVMNIPVNCSPSVQDAYRFIFCPAILEINISISSTATSFNDIDICRISICKLGIFQRVCNIQVFNGIFTSVGYFNIVYNTLSWQDCSVRLFADFVLNQAVRFQRFSPSRNACIEIFCTICRRNRSFIIYNCPLVDIQCNLGNLYFIGIICQWCIRTMRKLCGVLAD